MIARNRHLRARACLDVIATLVLFLSVAATARAQEPGSEPTLSSREIVIKAARLVDGLGGPPLEPAMVLVRGERIVEVGRILAVPAGARVLDLGNATLLPGLIDLHTHLTDRFGVHWEDALVTTTPPEAALWGAHNARLTLLAGFTTCRDMGPTWPYVDVDLRNAIEAGAVPGPRLLVAGNYVSSTGGAGDARQFSIYVDVPLVHNLADGPQEIIKAVRTHLKHGADFIKILATGAVLSKGIPPGAQQYSDEEIAAAVTEASRWGRQVAAHAHGASGVKAAIRAGVRTVDHGSFLDDAAIELLRAKNTYYVPTLYTSKVVATSAHIPESEKERERQVRDAQNESFRRALAAGLDIGVGSDSAVIPHGENARELITRVELGETPMSAIVSATRINSEILGWSDRIGTVEPGKLADLAAFAGNPVDDIDALLQPLVVIKNGVVYREP